MKINEKTKQNNDTHSTEDGYNHRPLKGAQPVTPNQRNFLEDGLFSILENPSRGHSDPMALGISHSMGDKRHPSQISRLFYLSSSPFSSVPCSGGEHKYNGRGELGCGHLLRMQGPKVPPGMGSGLSHLPLSMVGISARVFWALSWDSGTGNR